MKTHNGFTIIELLIVLVFASVATGLFIHEKATITSMNHDKQRKTAINAMHYALEEVYFPKNNFYPSKIDSKILPSIDPDLFKDVDGVEINQPNAQYNYEGTGCNAEGKCKGYKLKVQLEKEGEYTKTNRSTPKT